MDVHRDFCEVAIAEDGAVRTAGRVATTPEVLELFAQSLAVTDAVAIEATPNALAIARIVEPHVPRVVLANPKATRDTSRRAKTDKIDAKVLAQLLAAGFLDRVWTPDEAARTRRRLISRQAGMVRHRTREKNQIHAALQRNLVERQPMSDLFGDKGRTWLAERVDRLPLDERLTVEAGCARSTSSTPSWPSSTRSSPPTRSATPKRCRSWTLPWIRAVTAIALLGAIGDIARFKTPRHLVGYLGLDPGVRQSAQSRPATDRSASRAPARCAGCSSRPPGTPRGRRAAADLHGPLAGRRSGNIATVAVARKLVIIAWQLLSRGENYAFMRPALHAEKIRKLELSIGARRQRGLDFHP